MIDKLKDNFYSKSMAHEMKEARDKNFARTEKGYVTALNKLYIDRSFQVFLKDTHTPYY